MKNTISVSSALSLALLGGLALLAGCAETPPVIKYEADRTVDVSGYKKFVLVQFNKAKGIEGQDASPGAGLKYAPTVTAALKNTLTAKGYTEAPIAEADFVVNVRASIVPQTDITNWGMSYGYPGYGYGGSGRYGSYYGGAMGYNTTVDQYHKGVLRVEIYDTKKKDLVWVGWAEKDLYSEPKVEAVAGVISSILTNFPPPPPSLEQKK
jgi:hypothetical protein